MKVAPQSAADHTDNGVALYEEEDLQGAITHLKKAIELDPKLSRAHGYLGLALRDNKDLSGARTHLQKAIDLKISDYRIYSALATLYHGESKFDQAEPLFKESVAMARGQFGAEATEYSGQLALYGLNLVYQKKHAEAETPLRECLTIREKQQPDSWITFYLQSVLGGALLGQKKYAAAEPLLLKGYDGLKLRQQRIPAVVRAARLTAAVERLIQLYDDTGKKDEAAKWRKTLLDAKAEPQEDPSPPLPKGVKPLPPGKLKSIFDKQDRLSADDGKDRIRTESHHKVFTVKMQAKRVYVINMASTEFDPYLRLEDPAGKQLDEDDDGGGFLNARIIITAPLDGDYRIIATSYEPATGGFTLTVREAETKEK